VPSRISGYGVTQSSQIPYRIIDATLAEPQKTFGLQLFDPNKHLNSGTETTHPQSLLPKEITASMHALQLQRLLIPSAMPTGIDPYSVIQNRETLIKNRINYRIGELETQTSNITNEPPLDSLDYNLKIKAVIELKMLKLLDRQKKIREELLVGMSNATTLATAVDRSGYRRMKKQTLREARQTEKLERNQRQEKEKKEKQKHVDYLNAITNHSRDMLNFHRSIQSKVVRLGQNVIHFISIRISLRLSNFTRLQKRKNRNVYQKCPKSVSKPSEKMTKKLI
jgi:ATP-dependent helicase STH1/SNF2